jgi:predicted membrane protein
MNNRFIKNIVLHIKYPYTALIIAVMWIGIAIIITTEQKNNFEALIIATSICTLIIAGVGFRSPK